jgi:hypothetical protein
MAGSWRADQHHDRPPPLTIARRPDLVLHRGRIHEEGPHAELLRRGGLYARLYEVQTGAAPG